MYATKVRSIQHPQQTNKTTIGFQSQSYLKEGVGSPSTNADRDPVLGGVLLRWRDTMAISTLTEENI